MIHYTNYINNQWVDGAQGGEAISVINPATGTVCATVSAATHSQVTQACETAVLAQKIWGALPSIERGNALRRLADALMVQQTPIASALIQESGKSVPDAMNEVLYAADITRYHSEWARRIEGEIIPSDSPQEHLYLHRVAIGVVVCLIPFNFPVYTLMRKIAPALMAGNAVLVRPSNQTPCNAFEIAKAIEAAQLPTGLVSIMTMQHDVAQTLCEHASVGMLTLTGGVPAGRQILEYSKVNIAKVSLELGGKTPALVMPDANIEHAAVQIVSARTAHCGQRCTAVERVYAHEDIHDALVAKLQEKMTATAFGDRALDAARMGPLQNAAARERIHALVLASVNDGAQLLCGGEVPAGAGYFYPPTLLSGVKHDSAIVREEIFGPVLCVIKVKNFDEALVCANDHQYGLACVLFTQNHAHIMQASSQVEAGELYINRTPADPYQGYHAGWKRSGLGGDDGKHGLLEFTQTRLVIMNYQA